MANAARSSWVQRIITSTGIVLAVYGIYSILQPSNALLPSISSARSNTQVELSHSQCSNPASGSVDISWYPPSRTKVNSLESVIDSTGVYGFVFDSSTTPDDVPYNTYNWCNMPRVRANEYKVPPTDYELQYIEVIHRHHKRTPYAANVLPHEQEPWSCSDAHLYYYATSDPSNSAAQITWQIKPPSLPIFPQHNAGFQNSTCQFPQITAEGLEDCHRHGQDLRSVYIELLHFLPEVYDPDLITFRVTNNVITSQVASQVVQALFPSTLTNNSVPVAVQPPYIDSLEPTYPCPASKRLYNSYSVGSSDPNWLHHLHHPSTRSLLEHLDSISGVNKSDPAWHDWVDHYFDNLSSKLCHGKSLGRSTSVGPSSSSSSDHDSNESHECITRAMADAIFRRGLYEYSYIYRDHPTSLTAARGGYGIYLAEVAYNLRTAVSQHSPSTIDSDTDDRESRKKIKYRHNIAHDGSIARLLSLLQVDVMVWPGMGSEVVFELYRSRKSGCWYVRLLWMGETLRSSSPTLSRGGSSDDDRREEGEDDGMIPLERFLGYVDGLVGVEGRDVEVLCDEEVMCDGVRYFGR